MFAANSDGNVTRWEDGRCKKGLHLRTPDNRDSKGGCLACSREAWRTAKRRQRGSGG